MNNARITLLPKWMGRKQWAMVRARRQTFQGPRFKRWLRALSSECEWSSTIFCASPASEECGYQGREIREIFSQKYEQHKLFPRKTFEGNEGGNRQNRLHSKVELHLGPDCGLWAICPVFMEMTYQLENQAPWMEEPQGSYLDSLVPKRIP